MSFEQAITDIISGRNGYVALDPHFLKPMCSGLALFGTQGHNFSYEQIDQRLSEVRGWMQDNVDGQRLNAVYLDTTTIHAVEKLIRDKEPFYVTPGTLLDLSTFVDSVVLYDTIFHLQNQHIDSLTLNKIFGNKKVFISLPVKKFSQEAYEHIDSIGKILSDIWDDALTYGNTVKNSRPGDPLYEDGQAIREAWKIVFGMDEEIKQYFSGNYKDDTWASDPPVLLYQLVSFFSTNTYNEVELFHKLSASKQDLSYLVSECNYRCLFNLMVGYFLKLPYLPNSYRMPFRNFFYRKAKIVQRSLPSIKYIEAEYNKIAESYFAPEENNLTLPFFLSALFSKISSLDEFFEELARMRHKASAFRKHRAELDAALVGGDGKIAKKLQSALQKDAKDLQSKFPYIPIAGATAAVLAAFSAVPPIILPAIAILAAISLFPSEEVEKLKQRVLSPQYCFLTNTSDLASGLTNAYPKISKLWNLESYSEQEAFASHFARLKGLKN